MDQDKIDKLDGVELYTEWFNAMFAFKNAQELERKLRAKVVAKVTEPRGTHYLDVTAGYRLKVVKGETIELMKDDPDAETKLDKVTDMMLEYAPTKILGDEFVTWKPSLSLKVYDTIARLAKTDPRILAIRMALDDIVLIKPSAAQVAISHPASDT